MFEIGSRTSRRGTQLTVAGFDTVAVVPALVEVLEPDGTTSAIAIGDVRPDGETLTATGAGHRARGRLSLRPEGPLVAVDLEITWTGAPAEAGLRFGIDLPGRITRPRWLVPGCFYRENRPPGTAARYPRAVLGPGDPAEFESPTWSFRSDRAATPAVFGWTDEACVGIAADSVTPVGMSGLGFSAVPAPRIWVDLPYREEPVVYRGNPAPAPAEIATHRWQTGETCTFRLLLSVRQPDPHAYIPLVRSCYGRDRPGNPLAAWMGPAAAAELAAHGLYTWHWHPEHDALYETATFDRAQADQDRASMHVAWVSGIPWAQSLLAYGRRVGIPKYVDAGARLINHICAHHTAAGTF